MAKVTAIIGGQFGSEAKGNIVAKIAHQYEVHVRVGAPNAGHSYRWNGRTAVRQVIPVGHINPNAMLVIGRGALVNPRKLIEEIDQIMEFDPDILDRLYVDSRAGVLSPWHEDLEGHTNGEIHQRIGSTGEGVGAARVARINRDRGVGKFQLFEDIVGEHPYFGEIISENTPKAISNWNRMGMDVLLEGSQGFGLDLIHGTWPYCTSTGTGTAQLLADVGIPPKDLTDSIMVLRTFPIRVAGNSGPLNDEVDWDFISQRVGKPVEERTTVTKKVRRIGRFDFQVVRDAITINGPTEIALNFLDYEFSNQEGIEFWEELSSEAQKYISWMEEKLGVPIRYIGTGGEEKSVIER